MLTTPGKIALRDSAAASALCFPPGGFRQSLNTNNDCRTGLLYDILPLSTSVIFLTPQPWKYKVVRVGLNDVKID